MTTEQKAPIVSLTVEINAPAQLVWDTLVDFPRYGEWNPFNPKVDADFRVGGTIEMEVNMGDPNANSSMTEIFSAIEAPHKLVWGAVTSAETGDRVVHDHFIEAVDANRSRYWHSDTFFGPNAQATATQFGEGIKAAFDSVALALKARAEELYKK